MRVPSTRCVVVPAESRAARTEPAPRLASRLACLAATVLLAGCPGGTITEETLLEAGVPPKEILDLIAQIRGSFSSDAVPPILATVLGGGVDELSQNDPDVIGQGGGGPSILASGPTETVEGGTVIITLNSATPRAGGRAANEFNFVAVTAGDPADPEHPDGVFVLKLDADPSTPDVLDPVNELDLFITLPETVKVSRFRVNYTAGMLTNGQLDVGVSDSDEFVVRRTCKGDFQITLTWSSPSDLDLVVEDPRVGRQGSSVTAVSVDGKNEEFGVQVARSQESGGGACQAQGLLFESLCWGGEFPDSLGIRTPDGKYRTVVVHADACPEVSTKYALTVRVDGDVKYLYGGTLLPEDPESSVFTFQYPFEADLALMSLPSDTRLFEGEDVTFDVTVSNEPVSRNEASGVQVSNQLPAGLRPVLADLTDGQGSYDLATGVWTVGVLPIGTSTRMKLTAEAEVLPGNDQIDVLDVRSSAVADQDDPDPADNRADRQITVVKRVMASFNAMPDKGEAPLLVTFTDTSQGVLTDWQWDFGDGGTSAERNPLHTFQVQGTYTVTLTVTGPDGMDTTTGTINAFPPPVAAFQANPTSGPASLSVAFTNTSTGVISGVEWDFGDGSPIATGQNPIHTYTVPGIYDARLTVTGPGGVDVATRTITVYERAVARFSANPDKGIAPHVVTFDETSTGDIDTWSWAFGDGGSSSAQDPVHTYVSPGVYTVTLTVSGKGGTDTATGTITVYEKAVASFRANPDKGPAPLVVSFDETSTGDIDTWSWVFGDGGTSSARDVVHTYAAPGDYTVTLTVSGNGGTDTATGTIMVFPPPSARFSANPAIGGSPLLVQFTDLSDGPITSWSWDFDDEGSSSLQHPTHTFFGLGVYTVRLTVTGPGGSDTTTGDVEVVLPPKASFVWSPGGAPITAAFTDTSSGGPITSWTWSFDDGTQSSVQDPVHVFPNAGSYRVKLDVIGPGGSSTTEQDVLVLDGPRAFFVGSQDGPTYYFSDQSTGPISSWLWDFGDGSSSTEQHPEHDYSAGGNYDVTLTVSGPWGSDSITRTITFFSAPGADFDAIPPSGPAPLTVQFNDTSSGTVSSWSWTFDAGSSSTLRNPVHTFDSPGAYPVTLIVDGPGGSDSVTKTVFVEDVVSRPPRLSGIVAVSTGVNNCIPNPPPAPQTPHSSFTISFDYFDANGDVTVPGNPPGTPGMTDVEVSYVFSNGASGAFNDNAFSVRNGNGFQGSFATGHCYLFGGAAWVDVTLRITDSLGNVSNAVTTRVFPPAGANRSSSSSAGAGSAPL